MEIDILDDINHEINKDNKPNGSLSLIITVQVAAAFISTALEFYWTESILGSGPIGSIIGLLTFLIAQKNKNKMGKVIGLSAPLISFFCLILIVVWDWSPGEANIPIFIILFLYSILLLLMAANYKRL